MKALLKVIFLLGVSIQLQAQEIPKVILKDSTSLKLLELHIKTNITGNVATTTYNMKFYNATDQVLEGELSFPLGQGQSVIDFAMDVNGELRHAVIVEKELGRIAYESTVRQTIDPGLLEMTKGNNYKARVYPIPANGFKEIQITYEQVLFANNKLHVYYLPLNFKNNLSKFSINIKAYDKKHIEIVDAKNYMDFKFSEGKQNIKTASFKAENYTPNTPINIELQLENSKSITTYNDYFNLYKVFETKQIQKEKPKSITILWDASYSMEYRNLKKELELLNLYIKYLNDVKIEFVSFNNKVNKSKNFEIVNGNWELLNNEIKSIVYDGGTSFVDLNKYRADEYLLFTDGMDNLGSLNKVKVPVYTINAVTSANHNKLQKIATQSAGNYVNLSIKSVDLAFSLLINETYQFLGITKNDHVFDVYPIKNTNVAQDFSLSGRFKEATEIELLFGYNNKITDRFKIDLNKTSSNPIVKRLWAKQKLEYLRGKKLKTEIIKLAKKYHLLTNYTSMIILDRIEDYVRYRIEPPKELKEEYKRRLELSKTNDIERLEDLNDRREELKEDYADLMKWYHTDFSKLKKLKKVVKKDNDRVLLNRISDTLNNPENNINNSLSNQMPLTSQNLNSVTSSRNKEIDSTKHFVYGVIKDNNGSPLVGANIYIKNKSRGTTADFDGEYAINADMGDVLVYSYIGYITKEIELNNESIINISLEEDSSTLDEIVVIGYGTQRKKSITGSVSVVSSKSVEASLDNSFTNALQGKISGVEIQQNSGMSGGGTSIKIRGLSSVTGDMSPLYIVDGVPYTKEALLEISTKDIDNIRVLKNGSGSSIYGARANNGVIIISTKEGLETNSDKIEELNKKIDEEIQFKPWTPKASYLEEISKTYSKNEAFNKYIELRKKYKNTPTFFIDVAEFFESINENELAIQIITNLVEIDIDNHELMKALGYKLESFGMNHLAVHVYKEILELRPEEPQSYRDLALAYENIGEYQKAFDLLYKIIYGDLLEKDEDERFHGIEQIAYVEACHIVTKYSKKLKLNYDQKRLIKNLKIDVRVVVDWNHNDTDLDLWVENPNAEKILYSNKNSKDGGRLSEDMMDGYGPEEFMIKKAFQGDYNVLIDYYADEVQKISGPTTLKVTMFTNYGSKSETKKVKILRLDKEEDELEVGKIKF
ncbi:VIT domain-containing protein [Flavivirga algicola]|uniref:TonB-dependent receptor plug domain-containing protein n=1 Tax=Flavivirga algicola TaxID=2729136 RepID=A0ABX1S060_9FLAO|nr:VIT domain-containing protein [Flavivirga algicola]NMH88134.1 TonB-dependent receptor plug domain-containing protein [Flavivirga algicola]